MAFVVINTFFLLSHVWAMVSCVEVFCNQSHQNGSLVDTVFSANDMIYAFRRPDIVWLLKYFTPSGCWKQLGDALPLKKLFLNFPLDTIDAVFVITDFVGCNSTADPDCPFRSQEFDAEDITFVFLGQNIHLYRRVNDRQFRPIDWTANQSSVPWGLKGTDSLTVSAVFQIDRRVDGALYFAPNGTETSKRWATLFSWNTITDNEVRDSSGVVHWTYPLPSGMTPGSRGNGGFVRPRSLLHMYFIVNNKLYNYNTVRHTLVSEHMTSWEYFNCDDMPLVTEPTDQFNEHKLTIATKGQMIPNETERPPLGVGAKACDEDRDYDKHIFNLMIILFILVCIAMFAATILSYISFKVFT